MLNLSRENKLIWVLLKQNKPRKDAQANCYSLYILTVYIEDETVGDHTNIKVGLPLFMEFNLVIDYFNDRLCILPNQHFNKSFDKP
jgi:hypothetical protein